MTVLNVFVFGQKIFLVDLIEHLLSAIVHNLLVAIAAEAELESVWVVILSENNVLTIVVVVKGFRTHLVPKQLAEKTTYFVKYLFIDW